MSFRPRNLYYLRISNSLVLPLFLYLDERHIVWMSDIVLQRVLADLRSLIIPKLQAERDIHFGPGATPGTKRGTVEVHRGETYQFAYFFRKTEPHAVLLKSRYFVTAPLRPGIASKRASPQSANQSSRTRTQSSVEQNKRKRKNKGKSAGPESRLSEDAWSTEESEQNKDPVCRTPRELRRVRKQRRIIIDVEDEDGNDREDVLQEASMRSPSPEADSEFTANSAATVIDSRDGDDIFRDESSLSPCAADIELSVEEETKPKPLLKLKCQSFSISGHCLCVVVEPWSSQHNETRSRSIDLGTSFRSRKLELQPSDECVTPIRRADTPLFFPESEGASSEALSSRERTIPLASLSYAVSRTDSDDGLIYFSQTLNAAGHMHTITADDDDDMDGAVLFGDADEMKELI